MLEGFRKIPPPAILSLVARRNREAETAALKAFAISTSAIAATMASRADDHGFIKDLMTVATDTARAPDPLTAIGSLASCPLSVDTATASGRWLSRLFDHELPSVIERIATDAGVRRSSAVSILSVVAPLVLTHVGRLMRRDNLHASGLSARLRRDEPQFRADLPRDFSGLKSFSLIFEHSRHVRHH
jgi:uncharacterized protein DUF937